MRKYLSMVLIIGVLLLAFAVPASAAPSNASSVYPENYDLSIFDMANRPSDATIKSGINAISGVVKSRYYKVVKSGVPYLYAVHSEVASGTPSTYTLYIVSGGLQTKHEASTDPTNIVKTYHTYSVGGNYQGNSMTGSSLVGGTYPPATSFFSTGVTEVTEILAGFVVDWSTMKVVSVTPTSGTLQWSHKGTGDYTIRITNPTGGDLASERTFTIPRSGATDQLYTLTGLKQNEQYGFYVSVNGGLETSRNFTTDSSEYIIKAFMNGEQLTQNAGTKVSAYSDLEIRSSDWTRFDVYVNQVLIKTVNSPQASTQILLTEFQSKIDPNLGANIEIKLYKDGSSTPSQIASFQASSFDYKVGESPAGLKPRIPQKPDSAWDLVGWLEYGIGWIIYLVESVVWLLGSTGGLIQTVWTGSSGFIAMLGGIFSFMPKEVTALMVLGMGLAVILRVFGR